MVVSITTIHEDGTTYTAPRPGAENSKETFGVARILSYGPGIQTVRVEQGGEIIREYGQPNPDKGKTHPTLWHVLNTQTEHMHDAHMYAARIAIERGNVTEAHHQMQCMDQVAQRYATFPKARKETVESMDSASLLLEVMYRAVFF